MRQLGVGPRGLLEHKLQRPEPMRYGGGEGGELLKQPAGVGDRQEPFEAFVIGGDATARSCPLAGEREQLGLAADSEDGGAGDARAGGYLLDRGACVAYLDEHLHGGLQHGLASAARGLLAQRRAVRALSSFDAFHLVWLYSQSSHLT